MKPAAHECDANHCSVKVSADKGVCPAHWKMLPREMQQRIYAAARASRTRAERLSSVEFLESWAEAVEFIARAEGRLERNAFRNLVNMIKQRQLKTAA